MRQPTRNPELTPELLAQFSAMLREQQRFRQDQISSAVQDEARGRPHSASAVQAEVNAVLLHGAHVALAEIDAALERMRQGSYGRCTVCGTGIAVERLEVLPQTARCIGCERRS